MFVGREKELAQLEEAYSSEKFKFFAVVGKEGTGKTKLLEEFCRDKPSIFFTAADVSSRANLKDFSYNVARFYRDETQFQFWDNAFDYIAERQKDFSLVLVIDDIDVLAKHDPVFAGVFTKSVHNRIRYSKIFLVISYSDDKFQKRSMPSSLLSGVIELESFLTDENVNKLKQSEIESSPPKVKNRAKFLKVSADTIILNEGEINGSMYKIICGRAVCYANYGKDDEIVIGSLKEGQTFGEYSLLTGEASIYTVAAFTDMLILSVDAEGFVDFIGANSDNSIGIMKNLAGMLKVMRANMNMLNADIISLSENNKQRNRQENILRSLEVIRSEIETIRKITGE